MKISKIFTLAVALLGVLHQSYAQDLLNIIEDKAQNEKIENAFKSHRVINSQSLEMLAPGALDFRILHRFGNVSEGYNQFWGLDQASMRIGFDYGISKSLMLGVGRSTLNKEYDGFAKYRILWQSEGKKAMPISLIIIGGMTINGEKNPFDGTDVSNTLTHRNAYYTQIVIGRKFNSKWTAQIAPIFLHQNVVANTLTPNNLYALELGGRYKFTNRVAFVWDYTVIFNRFPAKTFSNPLSLGVDIDTGGHVFQIHFTNAIGMNERALLTSENSDWFRGGFKLGFNLSRVFQIKSDKLL